MSVLKHLRWSGITGVLLAFVLTQSSVTAFPGQDVKPRERETKEIRDRREKAKANEGLRADRDGLKPKDEGLKGDRDKLKKANDSVGEESSKRGDTTEAKRRGDGNADTERKSQKTLDSIDRTGKAPAGYEGGRDFKNDGRGGGERLPETDANGKAIKYREWDVNPKQEGVDRGNERLVTGSDGSAYYTADHYKKFKQVR